MKKISNDLNDESEKVGFESMKTGISGFYRNQVWRLEIRSQNGYEF